MLSASFSRRLGRLHPSLFSVYCIAAAFSTYFCMYAFRKPFTAATFEGDMFLDIKFKTILIVAQVAGYTLSKFIGIRVVSEFPPEKRALGILGLIGFAHLSLLAFGMVPAPWNFVCLFLNGLPLGMVFGLVLGFLEGRRVTEALSAGLCASFIVSSGAVKSVGQYLILDMGVSEYWMPFYAGLVFIPLLLLSVWMLAQIPPPNDADEVARAKREPVDKAARAVVFRRHAPGLIMLIMVYTLLTILRSLRDDFGVEIWVGLGFTETPSVFAQSETLVALAVTIISGAAFLIRDNRRAFNTALGALLGGMLTMVLSTLAFNQGWLGGFQYMVVLGVGTYVPYVAYHTTLFERLIATFRDKANLGYLMYLADAFGYLGYVLILLIKNFTSPDVDFLTTLQWCAVTVGILSAFMVLGSGLYFRRKMTQHAELAMNTA